VDLVDLGLFATLLLLVVALIIIVRKQWVRNVPEEHVDLVERLGRYHRTIKPGRHMLLPSVDAVRARVDLRPQSLTLPAISAITADDRLLMVDLALRFEIVDPVRSVYEIADFRQALEVFTGVTLRKIVGGLAQIDALSGRSEIERSLTSVVAREAAAWGIQVNHAEITAIELASA
jgi:regulator of protease activity HflC (stomatin/prohibitin superfamily)